MKKINGGEIEIGGVFEAGSVNSQGWKKWRTAKGEFSYRGELSKSEIDGYGVFKWPDGR